LKKGDVIQHKHKMFEVLKVEHSRSGKRNSTMQVQCKDVVRGSRVMERFRPDENVECLDVTVTEVQLESVETTRDRHKRVLLHCKDDSFDDIVLDAKKLGIDRAVPYMGEGHELVVFMADEEPYRVRIEDAIHEVTKAVADAGRVVGSRAGSAGLVSVQLANGQNIDAPHHTRAGDSVRIVLPDLVVKEVLRD